MKLFESPLWLANEIINKFHKTHKSVTCHMRSYVAVEGDDWSPLCHYETSKFLYKRDLNTDPDADSDLLLYEDYETPPIVYTKGKILAAIIISKPVARFKCDKTFELTRICFTPMLKFISHQSHQWPSMIVDAACDYFQSEKPAKRFVTYIHSNQSGKYLEHAGFHVDKEIQYSKNSKGWQSRPNRSSCDLVNKKRFVKYAG